MKLENLEGEEAKKAIKDFEKIPFIDFVKKYNTPPWVNKLNKIIDKLKEKVKK